LRGHVQCVYRITAVPISLSLVTQAGLLENLHRRDTMIVEEVAIKVLIITNKPTNRGLPFQLVLLRSGGRRRADMMHCCSCQRRAGTLRCSGHPVVSPALHAVPSGEFQPAVDAERRGHRVHSPRCLYSFPLSRVSTVVQGDRRRGVGTPVRLTKANLLFSDPFPHEIIIFLPQVQSK
jgi:hypothetical protein